MVDTVSTTTRDLAPDLVGVKSRVSWSAIFGGTVIALATYLVLTLLLGAVGISLTEAHVRANAVAVGILIAMILTMVVSLFIGGWVSAQLTAGENRQEAIIYGFLTWAAVTGMALLLVGMGVRAGYFAVVGGSMVVQNNDRIPAWDETARQAGIPPEQIALWKEKLTPASVKDAATNAENQEKAVQATMAAAWTALVGTMLSMAAAVCGALVGRGTTFRLFPVAVARDTRPRLIIPGA